MVTAKGKPSSGEGPPKAKAQFMGISTEGVKAHHWLRHPFYSVLSSLHVKKGYCRSTTRARIKIGSSALCTMPPGGFTRI